MTTDQDLLLVAEKLGTALERLDKIESDLTAQAAPLAAAGGAQAAALASLEAALMGIKALNQHVLGNDLGALSSRVESHAKQAQERAQSLSEAITATAGELAAKIEATRTELSAVAASRRELSEARESTEQKLANVGAEVGAEIRNLRAELAARVSEFSTPKGLEPAGEWEMGKQFGRLAVVSLNGSSYISLAEMNDEKPNPKAKKWQTLARRGGGGGIAGEVPASGIQGVITVGQGGTNATTAADARSNLDVPAKPIPVTANTTASFGETYEVFASATFTDPTPQEGGYTVRIRNGTATIGGTAYTEGELWRVWHSGAWTTRLVGLGETPLTNVKFFGAKGDGTTDDTAAFNAALAAGSIFVPYSASNYIISDELVVPSNRIVQHAPGATLFRANSSIGAGKCCFYRNSDYSSGNVNIQIVGGIFDCNGANNTRTNSGVYMGGVGFRFVKVTNLTLRGFDISTARGFHLQLGDCHRFSVTDGRIWSSGASYANADGVHINGPASDGYIARITGRSDDDFVSIDADSGFPDIAGNEPYFSVTAGDIKRITIEDISMTSGYGCAHYNKAYTVEDIVWRNIHGTPTGSAVGQYCIRLTNYPNTTAMTGIFRRITMENITMPQSIWIEAAAVVEKLDIVRCSAINAAGATTAQRVKIYGTVTGLLIDSCELKAVSGADNNALVENRGTATDVTMRNCTYSNAGVGGAQVGVGWYNNSATVTNLRIEGCTFNNIYGGFVQVEGSVAPAVNNLTYVNNRHITNEYGIRLAGGTATQFTLNGNDFGVLDAVAIEVPSPATLDSLVMNGNTQMDGSAFISVRGTTRVITSANRINSLSVAGGLYLNTGFIGSYSGIDLLVSRSGTNGAAALTPVNGDVVNDTTKGVSTRVAGAWVPA